MDALDASGEPHVLLHIHMGHGNNDLSPLLFQGFDRPFRRLEDIAKLYGVPGGGKKLGFRCGDPEETDLETGNLHDQVAFCTDRNLAAGIKDIGAEPWKIGFGNPCCRHVRSKIKFMIAEHRNIRAHGVHQLDHLRALGQAGQDGWRNQIAAKGCNGIGRAFSFCH